jgi:hypothetical protein
MAEIHDRLETQIEELYNQVHKINPYYYPGCGIDLSESEAQKLAPLLNEIHSLEYDLRYTCKCGKPAEDMYDDYGIYAGKFCSEECCGLNLHWVNDGSECLDEDY